MSIENHPHQVSHMRVNVSARLTCGCFVEYTEYAMFDVPEGPGVQPLRTLDDVAMESGQEAVSQIVHQAQLTNQHRPGCPLRSSEVPT